MELTDTQKMQVRLLKLGALLIVVLLALFVYLTIKYPDTDEQYQKDGHMIADNAPTEATSAVDAIPAN